jgi:hypothetical protein
VGNKKIKLMPLQPTYICGHKKTYNSFGLEDGVLFYENETTIYRAQIKDTECEECNKMNEKVFYDWVKKDGK